MNCVVCNATVGEDKKFAFYMIASRQMPICKSCCSKGMRAGSGFVVSADGIIEKPRFKFGSGDNEARAIAQEEGWEAAKSEVDDTAEGVWFITQHWEQAADYYWFSPDGRWHHNVAMSKYDCFRRSCQNIRDYFGVWLEVCGTELGT